MKGIVVVGVGPSTVPEVAAAVDRERWDVARSEIVGYDRHLVLAVEMAPNGWAVVIPEPARPRWVDDLDACPALVRWAETWLPDPPARLAIEGDRPEERELWVELEALLDEEDE